MPYWKCFYHLVWSTKGRVRSIQPNLEMMLFQSFREKCEGLKCPLLGVNSAYDHVHLALEIPPALAVAEIVRQLKGYSSRGINHDLELSEPFQWQASYGVLTFGEKNLPYVLTYIEHQKHHHSDGTTVPRLENDSE